MSTIINADTSDGLKFTSDTSGEIKLQSAGADIATVNSSGITMASGKLLAPTGPAFSAWRNGTQSITNNTITKVQFNAENFDTNSNFDPSTNYRFTPTVAGYYHINGTVTMAGTYTAGLGFANAYIYKNGSGWQYTGLQPSNDNYLLVPYSGLVYLNGSTDYVEIYVVSNVNVDVVSGGIWTHFNGHLARAA